MSHHPVKSEPRLQGRVEASDAAMLVKNSHRLIDQSREVLQAADALLEQAERRYPMPVRHPGSP